MSNDKGYSDFGVMTFMYMGDGGAEIQVLDEDGKTHFVTALRSGERTMQYSPAFTNWVVSIVPIKGVSGAPTPTGADGGDDDKKDDGD